MHLDSRRRTLGEVFKEHKGNLSDKWEQYLLIYDRHLSHLQLSGTAVDLLEVGVQNGGSLQVWSAFLPAGSSITGVDIDPKCADLNLGPSIKVFVADAGNAEAMEKALGPSTFDVIIDDGSHRSSDIISTFKSSFNRIKPGGMYFIEDLHCSYFSDFEGGYRRPGAAIEYFKSLCDGLNLDYISDSEANSNLDLRVAYDNIDSITFYDSVVVVTKKVVKRQRPYFRLITGERHPTADHIRILSGLSVQDRKQFRVSEEFAAAYRRTAGRFGGTLLVATSEEVEPYRVGPSPNDTYLSFPRDGATEELARIKASRSWRWTAPIRAIVRAVRSR